MTALELLNELNRLSEMVDTCQDLDEDDRQVSQAKLLEIARRLHIYTEIAGMGGQSLEAVRRRTLTLRRRRARIFSTN